MFVVSRLLNKYCTDHAEHHLCCYVCSGALENYFYLCYVTVSFLLCYSQLGTQGASDIWKLALQDGYALSLFRDEVLPVHSVFEKVLGESKNKE